MVKINLKFIQLKYFFVLFLLLHASSVNGAVGCVPTGGDTKIYTTFDPVNGEYKGNKPFVLSNTASGCVWARDISSPCSITGGGPPQTGFLGDTTAPQECPIDTNTFILIISSVGFGAFMLRKKREANFSSK